MNASRLFLLSLLISYTIPCQTFGHQKVDSLHKELAAYTDRFLDNERGIGLLVSVKRVGHRDWHYASGLSEIDPPKKAKAGMVFRVASVSKLFCATAVLQLTEQKVIGLADPINKWLPKQFTDEFPRGDSIKILDLLQHTSGIHEPQGAFLDPINDTTDYRPLLLGIIRQMPQSYPYGSHFYSNANYNLLAEIVRTASGMSYEQYVNRNIIKPLKLKDTYVMALPVKNRFNGYIQSLFVNDYKYVTPMFWLNASDMNPSYGTGAADICSSTADLVRFYEELHKGTILSLRSVELMTEKTVSARHPSDLYGLGTMVFTRFANNYFYGHLGTAAGYKSLLVHCPDTDTYVAVAINVHGYSSERILQFATGLFDTIHR